VKRRESRAVWRGGSGEGEEGGRREGGLVLLRRVMPAPANVRRARVAAAHEAVVARPQRRPTTTRHRLRRRHRRRCLDRLRRSLRLRRRLLRRILRRCRILRRRLRLRLRLRLVWRRGFPPAHLPATAGVHTHGIQSGHRRRLAGGLPLAPRRLLLTTRRRRFFQGGPQVVLAIRVGGGVRLPDRDQRGLACSGLRSHVGSRGGGEGCETLPERHHQSVVGAEGECHWPPRAWLRGRCSRFCAASGVDARPQCGDSQQTVDGSAI